jgi:hypothetical protein
MFRRLDSDFVFRLSFYSDSFMILTKIAVKQNVDTDTRPHVCGVFLMFILALADGLCCTRFIYPILCWCWCSKIRNRSIDWSQVSRFLPEDGDRIQSPKRCVF